MCRFQGGVAPRERQRVMGTTRRTRDHLLQLEAEELDDVVRQAQREAPHAQAAVDHVAPHRPGVLSILGLPLQPRT